MTDHLHLTSLPTNSLTSVKKMPVKLVKLVELVELVPTPPAPPAIHMNNSPSFSVYLCLYLIP
jgi:hypothetical protein